MKSQKIIFAGLIIFSIFMLAYPKIVEGFFLDYFDLSTDKVEYYNYENILIHSNWTYYYNEDEYGFTQIHITNESGSILWQSQEYHNNSIYMNINLTVPIIDLELPPNKSQELIDIKLYYFFDNGITMISTYRESLRIIILNTGVYNFSMHLDKDFYVYNETCYINSSWYLIYNPTCEIANISFQLLDENQDIQWTSNYFEILGINSHILNINFSLLDVNFEESYQNFSIIAKYKNFDYLLEQNKSLVLTESLIKIYGPSEQNDTKEFYLETYELTTNKIQYYNYENVLIHSNWTYYYNEGEYGFIQIHIANESGSILWQSQEYHNNSIYMNINLTVPIIDLELSPNKSQELIDIKLYYFFDNGITMISTYRESIRINILNTGVYNFSMHLDKDFYVYNETCYINSSWYLIYNPISEIANISFQLLDENQDVQWTSNYFEILGINSHILNINFSLLDTNFEESYQNFSMIAKYKNFNYLLEQNKSLVLRESLIKIYGPSNQNDTKEFNLKIYELTTNKIQYYNYETIDIYANWTYYYNEYTVGFVQICILQENNTLMWESLKYHNRSTYMEVELSIPISNLNQNLREPQDLLNVRFFIFNNQSGEIISRYNDSITRKIEIKSSGVYNFSMMPNQLIFQYNDICIVNSSWYSQYNPIYETAHISFQLFDIDQNLKWQSKNFNHSEFNSISFNVNFSHLDLGLNRVNNTFTLIAYYNHYNQYLLENDSKTLHLIEIQIIGDLLKQVSMNLPRTNYYFTSTLDISANWEIEYSPDYEEAFIQIIIRDECKQIRWSSKKYNDTGLKVENWEITISELPLNFSKDFERLYVSFYLYWQDLLTLETFSENIVNKTVRLIKSNIYWDLKFEPKDDNIIETQVQVSEKETDNVINLLNIKLKILYNSSKVFENSYVTNSYGMIIVNFKIERDLFYGDNLFILETESELYNNTILTYNYHISRGAPLNPSNLSLILFTSTIVGTTGVLTTLVFFKILKKKKKLSSLTITID